MFVAVVVMVAMVVAIVAVFHQDMERNAGWKGNTVVAFFLNVKADEGDAFLMVVVFVVHHLEHHLNF